MRDRSTDLITCRLRKPHAEEDVMVGLHCLHGRTYVDVLGIVVAFVAVERMPFERMIPIEFNGEKYHLQIDQRMGESNCSLYTAMVLNADGDSVNLAVNFAQAYVTVKLIDEATSITQSVSPSGQKVLSNLEVRNPTPEEIAHYESENLVPILRLGDSYYTVLSSMLRCRPPEVDLADMMRAATPLPVRMHPDPRLSGQILIERPYYVSYGENWPEGVVQLHVPYVYEVWPDGVIWMFSMSEVKPWKAEPIGLVNTRLMPGMPMSLGVAMSQLSDFAMQQGSVKKPVRR